MKQTVLPDSSSCHGRAHVIRHERSFIRQQPPSHQRGSTLKQVATIDLPGPAGKRFDYLTIDYDDGYLLSAHLGAGLLYVIDLKTNKVVKTIPDVPGVEGVEYVPELKKVYTSDWHEKKIGVIDLRQGKVIAKLPAQQKPDGSAYAPPFHKLYVSDERAKTEIVVDVQTDKVVNTLSFKSETGMPQYDPMAKLIYINLQELDTMTVIDPATDKVKDAGIRSPSLQRQSRNGAGC